MGKIEYLDNQGLGLINSIAVTDAKKELSDIKDSGNISDTVNNIRLMDLLLYGENSYVKANSKLYEDSTANYSKISVNDDLLVKAIISRNVPISTILKNVEGGETFSETFIEFLSRPVPAKLLEETRAARLVGRAIVESFYTRNVYERSPDSGYSSILDVLMNPTYCLYTKLIVDNLECMRYPLDAVSGYYNDDFFLNYGKRPDAFLDTIDNIRSMIDSIKRSSPFDDVFYGIFAMMICPKFKEYLSNTSINLDDAFAPLCESYEVMELFFRGYYWKEMIISRDESKENPLLQYIVKHPKAMLALTGFRMIRNQKIPPASEVNPIIFDRLKSVFSSISAITTVMKIDDYVLQYSRLNEVMMLDIMVNNGAIATTLNLRLNNIQFRIESLVPGGRYIYGGFEYKEHLNGLTNPRMLIVTRNEIYGNLIRPVNEKNLGKMEDGCGITRLLYIEISDINIENTNRCYFDFYSGKLTGLKSAMKQDRPDNNFKNLFPNAVVSYSGNNVMVAAMDVFIFGRCKVIADKVAGLKYTPLK